MIFLLPNMPSGFLGAARSLLSISSANRQNTALFTDSGTFHQSSRIVSIGVYRLSLAAPQSASIPTSMIHPPALKLTRCVSSFFLPRHGTARYVPRDVRTLRPVTEITNAPEYISLICVSEFVLPRLRARLRAQPAQGVPRIWKKRRWHVRVCGPDFCFFSLRPLARRVWIENSLD